MDIKKRLPHEVCYDAADEILRQRAEIERLRATLKDMLLFFGKPRRDEWMNEPAWKEACQVCENAKKILNEQLTTKDDNKEFWDFTHKIGR